MEAKSQALLWSSGSEDGDHLEGSFKSYTCGFCKRGFSNAQALGGHMNVHRRDRARLRQFSEENLLCLDISKAARNRPADEEEACNTHGVSGQDRGGVILESQANNFAKSSSHVDQFLDLELRLGPRDEPPEKPSGSRSSANVAKDLFRSSSH